MIRLALVLCGFAGLFAAEPTVIILRADPLVRPGLLYRCSVNATGVTDSGPWYLSVALVAGESVLAVTEIPVSTAGQLAAGITVAVVPTSGGNQATYLRARLSDQRHRMLARSQRELNNRQALYGRATIAVARLRATREVAPLPWLLAEQASELLTSQAAATIADDQALRRTLETLEAWRPPRAGTVPEKGTHLLAYREPVDTSVQPFRLTLPGTQTESPPVTVVMRTHPDTAISKSHWPLLPVAWMSAAATAGVAVLEIQPGGDGTNSGAALRRIPLAIAAARASGAVFGATYVISDAQGLDRPASWRQPTTRLEVIADRPLTTWASGPFVVVVGTGEHRSAIDDAEHLADLFIAAWATHARGLPPRVRDVDWRASDWPGHHVVLIGSPRGNSVTRALLPTLPLTWDDRVVTHGNQVAYRSLLPKIALTLPRPDAPTWTVLLLDGAPAWTDAPGALPFASAGSATLIFKDISSAGALTK